MYTNIVLLLSSFFSLCLILTCSIIVSNNIVYK